MLPVKTEYPAFSLEMPSTGQKVSFRPFIEKERKALLVAQEMGDPKSILDAIKAIVQGCCNGINVEDISIFDLEYIFIQLRARSINDVMKLSFRCHNVVNEKDCGASMTADINLLDIKVADIKKDLRIKLSPNLVVKMKYPSLGILESPHDPASREYIYDVLVNSIDFIADGENIYYAKEYSKEDMMEFILSLINTQFKKLEEFLEDLPVLRHQFDQTCKTCGFTHKITLEGYQDFFI